jgi:hypothetical protein
MGASILRSLTLNPNPDPSLIVGVDFDSQELAGVMQQCFKAKGLSKKLVRVQAPGP